MGWFDGTSEVGGESSHHHHHSHHKSSSRRRSHSSPRASSIFGLGEPRHNSSRSSFFGFNVPRSSSSYYRRSPRKGYVNRVYSQLRRLLRDLIYYMKKHPMKVFMLVIMPLITSGAVAGLLTRFGIRLPGGIEKMFGAAGAMGTGIGRGRDGLQFERTRVESHGLGGGLGNIMSGVGGVGGAMSLAKMFM